MLSRKQYKEVTDREVSSRLLRGGSSEQPAACKGEIQYSQEETGMLV